MKHRIVLLFALATLFVPFTASAQGHASHYVLDAFGGVHAGGGAPVISPATPYFGFDVAADIEYIPVGTSTATGDGILVLDKFGGVHQGGALVTHPPSGGTPYFGFDAARAIVFRDVPTRVAGSTALNDNTTSSTSFIVLESVNIHAPTDGYLLVSGTTNMYCSGVGGVRAEAAIDVDGSGLQDNYFFDAADCNAGAFDVTSNVNITKVFPVTAGTHTANLLGRKSSGTQSITFDSMAITALFVAANGVGTSAPIVATVNEPARPSGPDGRNR